MKGMIRKLTLGTLICALYEEAAKITPKKKLQTKLVCLTLLDMQHRVVGAPLAPPAGRMQMIHGGRRSDHCRTKAL